MKKQIQPASITLAVIIALAISTCNQPAGEGASAPDLGTDKKPIVMAFVPSTEAEKIVEGAGTLMQMLEDETGYKFKDYVATSYIAVVEALGKGHVQVAWLPTLAYVLAHQRNGAEVVLKVVRQGQDTYHGLIITRVDSGVETLEDLKGETFAFVDAASASGHLYPRALLLKHGVDPDTDLERYVFAGGHDSAVLAVYKGNVAAGAIYDDAREKFSETMPEIFEQTKIIGKTDPIPSDTVTIAADVPPEVAEAITQALLGLVHTEEGKQVMYEIYNIENLVPASDGDYDSVRDIATILDLDLEKQVRGE